MKNSVNQLRNFRCPHFKLQAGRAVLVWLMLLLAPSLLGLLALPIVAQIETGIIRSTLRPGSRGAEVSEVQSVLKLLGYYTGPVNGIYDEATTAAVSRFQQAAGIPADGIMGPVSWSRLLPSAPETTAPAASPSPTPSPRPTPTPTLVPAPPRSAPSGGRPILRRGARGADVERLQTRLIALGFLKTGVDGVFGEQTELAVREAQRRFRLADDGVVGPATWAVLEEGLPVLRRGARGASVERLQTLLRGRGLLQGSIDGVFGDATEAAVRAAQRQFRLEADGVVGPATWDALLR